MSEEKTAVSVEFKEDDPEPLPVVLDERAIKRAQRLQDIAANEKLGVRSIKLRLNTYKTIKKQIDALGLRTVGQCTLLVANDRIESVLSELDVIAQEVDQDSGSSKTLKMELRRLKLECIKMMMASGTDQLKADRQQVDQQTVANIQLPFPAGTPIAVAIGTKPANLVEGESHQG